MNRRILIASAAALLALTGTAPLMADDGDSESLQWSWRVEPDSTAKDVVTLVASARIAEGYIVYGSDFKGGLGPRPSRLRVTDANAPQPEGAFESVAPKKRTDKNIGTEYTYFEKQAEFRQKLRLPAGATHVAGRIEGQTCYEKDGTCTLFRQAFDVPVSAAADPHR